MTDYIFSEDDVRAIHKAAKLALEGYEDDAKDAICELAKKFPLPPEPAKVSVALIGYEVSGGPIRSEEDLNRVLGMKK